MPTNQIKGGHESANSNQGFINGELVLASSLNNITREATLLKGAITQQPSVTATKSGTYSYTSGTTLTVTSTAHGMSTGEMIRATFSQTSGGLGSQFNGAKQVTVNTVDTFTIPAAGTETASSGNVSFYTLPATNDELLAVDASDSSATTPKRVAISEILRSEQDAELKSVTTSGAITVKGQSNLDGPISANGKLTVNTTSAFRLPVGTTAQRPVTPVVGDVRFNSETLKSEVWTGTKWKAGTGSPFEASGGDYIIGPDETVVSATFTSLGVNQMLFQKLGHNLNRGQIIEFTSSVAGYESGRAMVDNVNSADTFYATRLENWSAAPVSTAQSISYRKAGDAKIHVFTGSGNFVTGEEDVYAEVLIVGGGGGAGSPNATNLPVDTAPSGGGGGGVIHLYEVKFAKNTTFGVTVGTGGAAGTLTGNTAASSGGQSSVNGLIAYGGKGGYYSSSAPKVLGGGCGGNNYYGAVGFLDNQVTTNTTGSPNGNGAGGPTKAGYLNVRGLGYACSIANVDGYFGNGGFSQNLSINDAFDNHAADFDYGHGGLGRYTVGAGKQAFAGKDGIVIIRYPFFI